MRTANGHYRTYVRNVSVHILISRSRTKGWPPARRGEGEEGCTRLTFFAHITNGPPKYLFVPVE